MGLIPEQSWMLAFFIAVNFALAAIGGRLGGSRAGDAVWYASLKRPAAFPPDWIFGPIWSLVWLTAAFGAWGAWTGWYLSEIPATAIALYGGALLINVAWQAVGTGGRRLGQGTALAYLEWGTITAVMVYESALPSWGWCWMLPYWAWVGYCARLNLSLWRANRPEPPAPPELPAAPPIEQATPPVPEVPPEAYS